MTRECYRVICLLAAAIRLSARLVASPMIPCALLIGLLPQLVGGELGAGQQPADRPPPSPINASACW